MCITEEHKSINSRDRPFLPSYVYYSIFLHLYIYIYTQSENNIIILWEKKRPAEPSKSFYGTRVKYVYVWACVLFICARRVVENVDGKLYPPRAETNLMTAWRRVKSKTAG